MSDSYKEVITHDGKEVVHEGIQVVQPVPPGLESVPNGYPPAKKQQPQRKLIIGIVAAVAIVVIGLAVGLGVALTRPHSTPSSSSDQPTSTDSGAGFTSSASSSSTPEPSTSTSNPTSTTSTASGTKNASPTSIADKYTCPGVNNTEIHKGSDSYHVFCDADIHATNKKDLSSTVQKTFAECLGLCDSMNNYQKRADVALTWNFEGTGQQHPGTCWCVTGSNKKVISNPGNIVAVLATENFVIDLE
ncbi:uncharacterized protein KD926_010220 [Aspergillus affinis]|uniref:uncharacterized protein n=1 Tax=Aspergillus affinis TaxID=1070780 RepID=UPI0022FF30B7|nr:uncharacterized protein KD926_010220 [Aspergillus affinis]KAI9038887.1 hypothetical protein KD926_010220 [Aspergillus affinis]